MSETMRRSDRLLNNSSDSPLLNDKDTPATLDVDKQHPVHTRLVGLPVVMAVGITLSRILAGLAISKVAITVFSIRGTAPSNGASPRSLSWSFIHWDSLFMLDVAKHGYSRAVPEHASVWPVYPTLVRVAARGLHLSVPHAALMVSWVGFFVATWGVLALARAFFRDAVAYRAAVLFAWFPASVFLLAPYQEPVYIAAVVWALVWLVLDRPYLAAALAAVASAARPEGALVGAAIAIYLLTRRRVVQAIAVGAVSQIGVAAVTVFFSVRFHHLFEQMRSQNALWHRHFSWPFHPIVWSLKTIAAGKPVALPELESNTVAVFLLDDLLLVLAVAVTVWLVVRVRRQQSLIPLAIFAVMYVLVIASNGPFGKTPESADRILMCVVPLYLVAPALRSEKAWTILIVASAAAATLFQVVFNLGFWFT